MKNIFRPKREVIIKPVEDITDHNTGALRATLLEVVTKTKKNIVIDMSEIKMVDSIGIGLLISTYNSVNQYGGYLKLINLEQDLYKLFNSMRLNKYFILEKKFTR